MYFLSAERFDRKVMATKADRVSFSGQRPRLSAGKVERSLSGLVGIGIVCAILLGWATRDTGWIDPERGLGYSLGIIGGSMMLILLGYPLRKRMRRVSPKAGTVGFWFRFHMLLGLLGPLAILYHARFSWGSLNSTVAMSAMIIVATSGLVGRFLYSRVHRGYSGRKLELRALRDEMNALLEELEAKGLPRSAILDRLQPLETRAISAGADFWSSAGAVAGLGLETRRTARQLRSLLVEAGHGEDQAVGKTLAHFFEAVRRAAEFAFYDRLLRLWHLLHLPLFFLLVAAAILHIVAVHMY